MSEILSLAGSILFSLGGGAVIVFALSQWLGGVWAGRILENERATLTREHELLVRRRNVYTKLALSMRVFLNSGVSATPDQQNAFLAAYDEAALWASEEVIAALATFLDIQVQNQKKPGSVTQETQRAEFVHCITAMRRDCGFPQSQYQHRVVTF